MFKNNKEKDNNYISTEDVEKMYEYQKKAFNAQINEQNKKIEELVDYVSARFGEDVANSNIATKLKNIEKNLKDIETNYKTNLDKTTKALKKQIQDESKKIATDLNDAQTESYFKLLKKSESDFEKIKGISAKKEDVEKINQIDESLKKHIKNVEIYKSEIGKELKNTNQQIDKINYVGLSTKFDKKLKERCGQLDEQIKRMNEETLKNINTISKENASNLDGVQKNLKANADEIIKLQNMVIAENEKFESNTKNKFVEVEEKMSAQNNKISEAAQKAEELARGLEEKINTQSENTKANMQKMEELLNGLEEKVEMQKENVKQAEILINKLEGKLAKQNKDIQANMQKTEETVGILGERLAKQGEDAEENAKQTEESINSIDEKLSKEIQGINIKIKENELASKKAEKVLSDKLEKVILKVKENGVLTNKLDKKTSKELEQIKVNLANNETTTNELTKQIAGINESLVNSGAQASKLEQKLVEEVDKINKILQGKSNENSTKTMFIKINEYIQNNEAIISGMKVNLAKQIEQTREAINKLKDISKNKNIKLEEKINLANNELKQEQVNIKALGEKLDEIKQESAITLDEKLNEVKQENITILDQKVNQIQYENESKYAQFEANVNNQIDEHLNSVLIYVKNTDKEMQKINKNIQTVKNSAISETDQIRKELTEQLMASNSKNKEELENISNTVSSMENKMKNTVTVIGQEISKLEQELRLGLENQESTDVEELKENYNNYFAKINNELSKISEKIVNAQKKNQEQNKNLQIKIKEYIDAKIDKVSNTKKIDQIINQLNLSILQREKLQKIEMEELLDKKLKAIQKENERILNKKIQEMASKLFVEQKPKQRQNTNNITLYEEKPKKKKNMYELIDDSQILKRTATSKTPIKREKEEPSQILKFFYDDEDNV